MEIMKHIDAGHRSTGSAGSTSNALWSLVFQTLQCSFSNFSVGHGTGRFWMVSRDILDAKGTMGYWVSVQGRPTPSTPEAHHDLHLLAPSTDLRRFACLRPSELDTSCDHRKPHRGRLANRPVRPRTASSSAA